MGRTLTPEDDRTPGAHAVAVISDGFWRRSFGSDAPCSDDVFSSTITRSRIIGVAARGFTGTDVGPPTDIWLPMMMQREVGRDLLTESPDELARDHRPIELGHEPGACRRRAHHVLSTPQRRNFRQQFAARRLMLVPGDKGNSPVRRELGPALSRALGADGACAGAGMRQCGESARRAIGRAGEGDRRQAGARRRARTPHAAISHRGAGAGGARRNGRPSDRAVGQPACSSPRSRTRLDIDTSLDVRVLMFGLAVSVLTGLRFGRRRFSHRGRSRLPQASETPSAWAARDPRAA